MAKAKIKDEAPKAMAPQGMAAKLIANANKRATSTVAYQAGDHKKFTYGIPIPHLIFAWMIGGANVLPMQRIFSISGMPKSFKSTLAVELGVWHVLANGIFFDLDNESKTSASMLDAMTWWRLTPDQLARIAYKETASIDEWNKIALGIVQDASEEEIPEKGARIPIYIGIDSLTGKSSEESQEEMMKEGQAKARGYPVTVMQITNFLKNLSLMGMTLSLGYVRHAKPSMDPNEHGKLKEAGGQEASFRSSLSVMVKKVKEFEGADHPAFANRSVPHVGKTLRMWSEMSCLGPDKRVIEVDVLWQYIDQPYTEIGEDGLEVSGTRPRQIMLYDWAGALGMHLWKIKYGTDAERGFANESEKLDSVLKFTQPKHKHIKCEDLGLDAADFTEFGQAIESNPEVRKRVADFLGIVNYPSVQVAEVTKLTKVEE